MEYFTAHSNFCYHSITSSVSYVPAQCAWLRQFWASHMVKDTNVGVTKLNVYLFNGNTSPLKHHFFHQRQLSSHTFVGDIRKSSLKMSPDLTHNLGHLSEEDWAWTWFTDLILRSTRLRKERIYYHYYFIFCTFLKHHVIMGNMKKKWGDRRISCLCLSFDYFCSS